MSWFDLAALVVIVFAVLDGARSGLAWASLQTAMLLGAALVARGVAGRAEPYLLKLVDLGPEDLRSAAHVVVFALTACMLFGVLILLHPASKRWRFKHDRWFGGVLGAVNGALASLLLFSMAIWSSPRPSVEDAIASSRLVPVLRCAHENGFSWLFDERLGERLTQLQRP
jgi:uncharacterized membrane protein required for colicin V production